MPNKGGRNRRAGSSSKNLMRQEVNQMKNLVAITKSTVNQSTETVPDVPRMRLKANKVFTFSRSYSAVNITANTTVDQSGAITTSLSNFPNYNEFVNLFDEYRIVQLVYEFLPFMNTNSAPPIYTVIDPDDGMVPTSADQLRQFDTCRIVPSSVYFERTCTPMLSSSLYSGTFTSYGNIRPTQVWVDTSSASVQFYGLKYYWPAVSGATGVYSVNVVGIIQCRHLT